MFETLLTASNLFVLVIVTSSNKNISEGQQSFPKNRSIIDAIFIIEQKTEILIEFRKLEFLCFVDLTKVFDKIKLTGEGNYKICERIKYVQCNTHISEWLYHERNTYNTRHMTNKNDIRIVCLADYVVLISESENGL